MVHCIIHYGAHEHWHRSTGVDPERLMNCQAASPIPLSQSQYICDWEPVRSQPTLGRICYFAIWQSQHEACLSCLSFLYHYYYHQTQVWLPWKTGSNAQKWNHDCLVIIVLLCLLNLRLLFHCRLWPRPNQLPRGADAVEGHWESWCARTLAREAAAVRGCCSFCMNNLSRRVSIIHSFHMWRHTWGLGSCAAASPADCKRLSKRIFVAVIVKKPGFHSLFYCLSAGLAHRFACLHRASEDKGGPEIWWNFIKTYQECIYIVCLYYSLMS